MAQDGYDALLALTDSRYRLSMIVGRRAAQLKGGIAPTLDEEDLPEAKANTVSVAMAELIHGDDLTWGDDVPEITVVRESKPRERREFRGDDF